MVFSCRLALLGTLLVPLLACQRIPLTGASSSGGETEGSGSEGDSGQAPGGDPVYECDPVGQDCAQGEKCTPITLGGNQNFYTCVPDPGGKELFDACTVDPEDGIDSCDAGLVCLDDANEVGVCVNLCRDDGDCVAALCTEDPFENVPYCALECSPLDSLCTTGLQCRREQDRFTCQFPRDGDDGFILDACDPGDDSGCGQGVVCIQGELVPGCESAGCCSPVCDTSDPAALEKCQGDIGSLAASCVPLFDAPAPTFETFGACLVPAS